MNKSVVNAMKFLSGEKTYEEVCDEPTYSWRQMSNAFKMGIEVGRKLGEGGESDVAKLLEQLK